MIKVDKKLKRAFQIEIIETLSNIVEVNAENEQDALLKAQDMYRNEEWTAPSISESDLLESGSNTWQD